MTKKKVSYDHDLTLFTIHVVVVVSDLIIKQDGDVGRRCLWILIFALKVGNLFLQRSLVLLCERGGWNLDFVSGYG